MTSALAPPLPSAQRPLSRFLDHASAQRELIAHPGAGGSVLVIDRDALTHGDRRLVAHLSADEPTGNAALMARRYIEDASRRPCAGRRLRPEDALISPLEDEPAEPAPCAAGAGASLGPYRLGLERGTLSIPELRWRRVSPDISPERRSSAIVSLRRVVGALQCYEPALALTREALRAHRDEGTISCTALRQEHARLARSPIVLNRLLREVLLRTLSQGEVSMSEIAMRCGRIKRDNRGNESGETSWLARRVGLLPEGGAAEPTPWIHTDVLALIAREGLGVSPREVEL